MEKEEVIQVRYQHLANKKSYFLGIRPSRIFWVVLGAFFLLIYLKLWAVLILGVWVLVGITIDARQKKTSKNFIQAEIAWHKTKNIQIQDTRQGVLKIFRNGNNRLK